MEEGWRQVGVARAGEGGGRKEQTCLSVVTLNYMHTSIGVHDEGLRVVHTAFPGV